jgi:hypothetical protein
MIVPGKSRLDHRFCLQCLLVALVGSLGAMQGKGAAIGTVSAEQIPLTSVLPKLESLHEEVRLLLIKNAELKNKISAGLHAQTTARTRLEQLDKSSIGGLSDKSCKAAANATSAATSETRPISENSGSSDTSQLRQQQNEKTNSTAKQQINRNTTSVASNAAKQTMQTPLTMKQRSNPEDPPSRSMIDFNELEDFNKWVEINLEYAVKNTRASAETLKEEAQQNNGTVDYSDQAIKDGLEGVKYWQSAIHFQDTTLKNEKFVSLDEKEV